MLVSWKLCGWLVLSFLDRIVGVTILAPMRKTQKTIEKCFFGKNRTGRIIRNFTKIQEELVG